MRQLGSLYKSMGMNFDLSSMMKNLYKLGETDLVMGMKMDMQNPANVSMNGVAKTADNKNLKKFMSGWLSVISKKKRVKFSLDLFSCRCLAVPFLCVENFRPYESDFFPGITLRKLIGEYGKSKQKEACRYR